MKQESVAGTRSEAIQEIREMGQALVEALRRNDVDGILARATSDHLTMAPNEPVLRNGPALRTWHEDRIATADVDFDWNSEDIVVNGDLAVQHWTSEFTVKPHDGSEEVRDLLKGLWVWRRDSGGNWRLHWSIWNSDKATE